MKRPRLLSAAAAAAATIALATATPRAASAEGPHDSMAAEAAFSEARALIRQGKFAEACPKLEASFALDPALGTLLNLGDCFERTGRTASAWVRYREAAAMAVQQNQRARETIARDRVAALEPKLCRLVVRAEGRPQLEVLRDGVPIAAAAIGLPVPVDPGPHVIEARAPGAAPFSTQIEVKPPDNGTACPPMVVEIPALVGQSSTSGPVAPVTVLKPIELTPDVLPPPAPATSGWGTMHTLALVSAASGLVAIGIGSVFGLQAAGTKSDADGKCTSAGCSAEGKTLLTDAGNSADVATVTLVVGAALVATGAVLWFTSPSLRASSVALSDLRAGIRF